VLTSERTFAPNFSAKMQCVPKPFNNSLIIRNCRHCFLLSTWVERFQKFARSLNNLQVLKSNKSMLADVTLHRSEENLPETVKRKWFISFGFNVHERFLDYFHFVDYFVSWTFNSSKSFFTAVIQLHQPVQRCSVERDRVIRLSIRVRTR